MRWSLRFLSCSILLAGAVAAQRTWIVDAANGPGTHFTDLPPAAAAARPGDIIQVRPAPTGVFYTSPVVTKGITILGDPANPAVLLGAVEVLGLPAGPPFVLASVKIGTIETNTFSGSRGVGRGVICQDNLGPVMLDRVAYGLPSGTQGWHATDPRGVLIERCSIVMISRSTIWATSNKTTVRDSKLVGTDSVWGDSTPSSVLPAVETMFVERGTVRLVNSQVRGTNHSISWRGDSAILICRGTVHVGGSSFVLGGSTQGGGRWWGVEGSSLVACNPGGAPGSVLNLDPRSTVNSFGHVSRLTTNIVPVPALQWATTPGPGLATTQYTTPLSLTLLAAGTLIPPGIPTVFGHLHLEPGGLIVLDVGVATGTGLRTWTANLSPSLPLGTNFALQAAELTTTLDLHLTNVVTVVP